MAPTARDNASTEDRLAALHEQLVQAVEALTGSEAWMTMLRVAARFPTYSPSNVLLIAIQHPDATRVAGIRTWNAVGRRVNKGEHGIAILAPCFYRARDNAHAGRGASSDSVPVPRPAPVGDDTAVTLRELRGFKIVHVFDLSQTSGEPLPDVAPELLHGTAPDRLWQHLTGLVATDGYRLERGECRGANGWTDYSSRIVRIREDVEPLQAIKTLAHELGHIHADHEHRFPTYAIDHACRGQAEVEAESIAYLVTASAGLDSLPYTVPYVAGWSDGDPHVLRHAASTVVTTARALLPAARAASDDVVSSITPTGLASAGNLTGREPSAVHPTISLRGGGTLATPTL